MPPFAYISLQNLIHRLSAGLSNVDFDSIVGGDWHLLQLIRGILVPMSEQARE